MSEIKINNLTKTYGEQVVLNHISLELTGPGIYGFAGRNGSGKTMLMKHICGFVRPDSGNITIDGKIVGKEIDVPDNLGIIIEEPGFLPEYSGFYNLRLLAALRGRIGKSEIRDAIRLVGLDPDMKKHVGKYSLGMRQRLGIAQAVMEDPDILLLDEPMNGLDNDGVEDIRRLLLELSKRGKLIVIASHTREDMDLLCDRIYRFDKGKIIGQEERR